MRYATTHSMSTPVSNLARPSPSAPRSSHYLSVDVEDVVLAAAELHARRVPAHYRDTVGPDLEKTLEVLARTNSRATFFVNGRYCEANDGLMRDIVARGHVLASHGYTHADVRRLSIEEFADEVRRSVDALSRYQGRVIGYRPPAFTMPFDEPHLLVLKNCGIRYVSCGAAFDRTNVPHCMGPMTLAGGIIYLPVSIAYFIGRWIRFPVGYGAVSRLLPERLYLFFLKHWIRRASYFQFYFHPWELADLRLHQKRILFEVNRTDIPQRIYALRCRGRAPFFARIFEACTFQPIETMEVLSSG